MKQKVTNNNSNRNYWNTIRCQSFLFLHINQTRAVIDFIPFGYDVQQTAVEDNLPPEKKQILCGAEQ